MACPKFNSTLLTLVWFRMKFLWLKNLFSIVVSLFKLLANFNTRKNRRYFQNWSSFYIFKVVISVCLSDYNSGTPGTIGDLGRTMEMLLVWFRDSKLSGSTFIAKKSAFNRWDYLCLPWATLGSQASILYLFFNLFHIIS